MAALLQQTFRRSDWVARTGGDEFVVLSCGCTEDGMLPRASHLARAVAHHNATAGHPWALAFSVGGAVWDPGRHQTLDDLLAEADQAMYRD